MISVNFRTSNAYVPFPISTGLPSSANELFGEKKPCDGQAVSLREQIWFHGLVRRVEAQLLLRRDGEFLVRESLSQPGRFVLSGVWASEPLHFEINEDCADGDKLYHFEGEKFPSIVDLVDFYRRHRKPITKASGLILSEPVGKAGLQSSNGIGSSGQNLKEADVELDATYAFCAPSGTTTNSSGIETEGKFSPLSQKVVINQARRMVMETEPKRKFNHDRFVKPTDHARTEADYDQIDYEAMDELRKQPTLVVGPPTMPRSAALSPTGRLYQKGKNAARMSANSTSGSTLPKMTRSASVASEEISQQQHTPSQFEFTFHNSKTTDENNNEDAAECVVGVSHRLPTLNGKSILNLIGDLAEEGDALFKTSDRTQSCHNLSLHSLGRRKSSSSAHIDVGNVTCGVPPTLPERRAPPHSNGNGEVKTTTHARELENDDDYSYFIPSAHSNGEPNQAQWVLDLLDTNNAPSSAEGSPPRNQKLGSPPIAPKPVNIGAVAASPNSGASVPVTNRANRYIHHLFVALSKVDKRGLALMMTEEDCRAFHLQAGSAVLVDVLVGEGAGTPMMSDLIQRASLVHDSVKRLISEAAVEGREEVVVAQITELASILLHDLGNAFAFGNIVSALKETAFGGEQKRAKMVSPPQALAEMISTFDRLCRGSIDGCLQRNHHPTVQLLPFIQPFFPVPSLLTATGRSGQHLKGPAAKLGSNVTGRMNFLWSFIVLAKQTLGAEQWPHRAVDCPMPTTVLDNPFTNEHLAKLIRN